jgi:hypothetical protein
MQHFFLKNTEHPALLASSCFLSRENTECFARGHGELFLCWFPAYILSTPSRRAATVLLCRDTNYWSLEETSIGPGPAPQGRPVSLQPCRAISLSPVARPIMHTGKHLDAGAVVFLMLFDGISSEMDNNIHFFG